MVQSNLTLGGLKAFFHRPACSSNMHLCQQRRVGGGKGNVSCQLARVRDAASYQQPTLPALLLRLVQLQAQPVVHPQPFRTRACTQALPFFARQVFKYRFDLLLKVGTPHAFLAGNRQHIRLLSLLEPLAQGVIVAVDTITCNPSQYHPCFEGALEHLLGQGWFGCKEPLVGNACVTTAFTVVSPNGGQIQFAVKQCVA